jgi:hypothetical protein
MFELRKEVVDTAEIMRNPAKVGPGMATWNFDRAEFAAVPPDLQLKGA